MNIRIVPFTEKEEPAGREFNERLQRGNPPFLMALPPPGGVVQGHRTRIDFFAAMEADAIRGGFILTDFPAWANGQEIRAGNCVAPISEGIVDSKYSLVSLHLVKAVVQKARYAFVVGMGDAGNPLPRLLKASGWTIVNVPMFFQVFKAGRFFRELRIFRNSPRYRLASRIAAITGTGSIALGVRQARRHTVLRSASGLTLDSPSGWGDWADELWTAYRNECSFAVSRDSKTLQDLYPEKDSRILRFIVRKGREVLGWATAFNTQMRDDKYFGDLRVATILDCIARPEERTRMVALVSRALGHEGADIVISNQAHASWQAAFREAGFLSGPSNFNLALSKDLAALVQAGSGQSAIHVTRGDGDGRMHL